MFKKLTYKVKLRLLLAGSLLSLWVFYTSFVADSFDLYEQQSSLKDSLKTLENAPEQLNLLSSKLKRLEKKAGLSSKTDVTDIQQSLLGITTKYCNENNCIIRSIPSISATKEKDISVETHIFSIEGSYKNLLQLVYLLEQKYQVGKVSSVLFRAETDNKSKKRFLQATYFIQHISKVKDEK